MHDLDAQKHKPTSMHLKKICFKLYVLLMFLAVYFGEARGVARGTVTRAPSHHEGANSLRGHRRGPTVSQVLSLMQYICFQKTSASNMWPSNFLLAPGAI